MEAQSFIGFGLALLASSWAISALLCGAVLAATPALRRSGPRAERRAAALAIGIAPLLGAAVFLALTGRSLLGAALGAPDHCPAHDHHLHLCLFHGAAWGTRAWAVAALAAAGAFLLVGAGAFLARAWTARRVLGALSRLARPVAREGNVEVRLVPGRSPFCFTASPRRPRVFVSTAAWERLDPEGREAMLAHEEAHVANGDLRWRAVLGALALLGAPVLAARILDRWRRACERVCDRDAARRVSAPAVAEALLALVRSPVHADSRLRGGPFVAFGDGAGVVERIEHVLEDRPDGLGAARRLGIAGALFAFALAAAAFALADPLHHALETLLGAF